MDWFNDSLKIYCFILDEAVFWINFLNELFKDFSTPKNKRCAQIYNRYPIPDFKYLILNWKIFDSQPNHSHLKVHCVIFRMIFRQKCNIIYITVTRRLPYCLLRTTRGNHHLNTSQLPFGPVSHFPSYLGLINHPHLFLIYTHNIHTHTHTCFTILWGLP